MKEDGRILISDSIRVERQQQVLQNTKDYIEELNAAEDRKENER